VQEWESFAKSSQTVFVSSADTVINKTAVRLETVLPADSDEFILVRSFLAGGVEEKRPCFFVDVESRLMWPVAPTSLAVMYLENATGDSCTDCTTLFSILSILLAH
jgi:hypothetical protein